MQQGKYSNYLSSARTIFYCTMFFNNEYKYTVSHNLTYHVSELGITLLFNCSRTHL
jgi:hypothetical protein